MERIVQIESGSYSAKINLNRGANCISLRNSEYGAVILREPDYSEELDNPYLYGMPILFPVNRISGGCFEFEGREYRFPINEPNTNCSLHGELHRTPFELRESGRDFVRCVYTSDPPYPGFLHRFRVEICYSLDDGGFHQKTTVSNLSEKNMPVFLGFHTTFNVPFAEGSRAEDIRVLAQVSDEIERNMAVYLPTGRILPPDAVTDRFNSGEFMPFEQKLSRHYKSGSSGEIRLRDCEKRLEVVYKNDEKFGWRLLYNGNADEYICLEPQTCMANCMNAPFDRTYSGFDFIEPGSSKEYESEIYLQKYDEYML